MKTSSANSKFISDSKAQGLEMMAQGGFTETIDAEEITFLEIEKRLISLVSSNG